MIGNRRLLIAGALLLALPSVALAGFKASGKHPNVLFNGTFERSTRGWLGYNARLAVRHDGVDGGNAAEVTQAGPDSNFAIDSMPPPVRVTRAQTSYRITGWVRAVAPISVCLRVREWSSGTVRASSQTCRSAASRWRAFRPFTFRVRQSGDSMDLYAYSTSAHRGVSFDVDRLALVVLQLGPAVKPTPPIQPASSGSGSPASAAGCTRYASPTGSDRSSGSATKPLRTVQRLVSSLHAGDTGCLDDGTYVGDVTITHSGTSTQPVALRAADGAHPIVRGKIWVTNSANYVQVSRLTVDNPVLGVSDVLVEGDDVTIADNDLTSENNGICVLLGGDQGTAVGTVLTGNRIHNCGVLPADNHGHGIYVEHSQDARILNNWIYDNADRGVQLYPDAQRTLIENNVIDGNGEGVIFSGDDTAASSNNTVTKNIITNSRIRSNIESWWGGAVGTGNVANDNCLWNGAIANIGLQEGFTAAGNVIGDPLYVDRSAHDYDLRAGSPCAGFGPQ